jgi:predicted acetyltransferase
MIDPGELQDNELELKLAAFEPHRVHKAPTHHFRMVHAATDAELGNINLRVASTRHIEMFAGHIGYGVHAPYRGHRYAARHFAC